jgi:hypothetical protein
MAVFAGSALKKILAGFLKFCPALMGASDE